MNVGSQCELKPFLEIFLLSPLSSVLNIPHIGYTIASLQSDVLIRLYISVYLRCT